MSDLLLCPCCQGLAQVLSSSTSLVVSGFAVKCSNCKLGTPFVSKEEAISIWNTRSQASGTTAEAILEAIHEHIYSARISPRQLVPDLAKQVEWDQESFDPGTVEYHLQAAENGVSRLFQFLVNRDAALRVALKLALLHCEDVRTQAALKGALGLLSKDGDG